MIYEENISFLVTSSSNPSDRVDLLPNESTAISSKLRSSFTPKVLFLFALLVIFGIANNVIGRWAQLKFGERYAFFGYQFYVLNYALIAQIISSYRYFCTKHITPEMKSFPIWKYAMFAFFDGTAAFLSAIGAPNTPASIQNIINPTAIPMTMLVTMLLINVRYQAIKLGGAGIIILGAFVALIPYIFGSDGTNTPIKFVWYSVIIYFSNNIPQAFSNVTKEMAFNSKKMDVWYFGAWIGWFQLLWTLLLLPITTFSFFGGHQFKDMPQQYLFGFKCWLGVNSQPGDECSYNYIITLAYFGVNFCFNILILSVTKHASATVFTLSFAVQLPLTQIAYSIPQIMQQYVEGFQATSIIALIIVLVGFAIYSILPEPQHSNKRETGDEEASSTPS